MTKEIIRCRWCGADPLYMEYHDKEWGKTTHDDKVLFEFLNKRSPAERGRQGKPDSLALLSLEQRFVGKGPTGHLAERRLRKCLAIS